MRIKLNEKINSREELTTIITGNLEKMEKAIPECEKQTGEDEAFSNLYNTIKNAFDENWYGNDEDIESFKRVVINTFKGSYKKITNWKNKAPGLKETIGAFYSPLQEIYYICLPNNKNTRDEYKSDKRAWKTPSDEKSIKARIANVAANDKYLKEFLEWCFEDGNLVTTTQRANKDIGEPWSKKWITKIAKDYKILVSDFEDFSDTPLYKMDKNEFEETFDTWYSEVHNTEETKKNNKTTPDTRLTIAKTWIKYCDEVGWD